MILSQCFAHLSLWITKLSLDEFNSNGLQMTFWGFDGDHVSHNSEKRLFIIAQNIFSTKLERLPLVMVGEVGDRLRVYLSGVPPTATALLEILILENYHDEKTDRGRKIDWLKWNQSKDCKLRFWLHCFSWWPFYDMYIIIDQNILISLGELAGGAENSPLVPADAGPLPFVQPCRWPQLSNWWAREAQLTES